MAFSRKSTNQPLVSPVYVGDRPAREMELSVISYDQDTAVPERLSRVEELPGYAAGGKTLWVNITGLKDVEALKRLGELYGFHPLSVEDILNTEQPPKTEVFDGYRFLAMKTVKWEKTFCHRQAKPRKKHRAQFRETEEFLIDQVSMVVTDNVLFTFQEVPGDLFDGLRRRIMDNTGGIRGMGTDYLAYAVIDAVVDEYFLTLGHLDEDLEDLEDRATKTSDDNFIEEIRTTKKYLLRIRRAISPLRDNVTVIARQERFFRSEELKPFLQDLSEHVNNAMTTLEHHREWLSNIMAVNLSVLSHQMNKVMKVLAMISTIFIPLTFIAGIYGMNFDVMPELHFRFAYPVVLGAMGLIACTMIAIFKSRRWF